MEESLAAHAKRAVRTRLLARVTSLLDAGIAALQGLRTKATGAPDASPGADGADSRLDRPRVRPGTVAPPAEADAPRPKRRLRAFLFHAGLMLAGGLGGAALAHTLFQKQLDLHLEASRRLEAALAEKPLPDANALKTFENALIQREQAEQKLASAFTEFSASADHTHTTLKHLLSQQFAENRRLKAVLAENTRSGAETRQALEKEQAARVEAESRLASALAEHEKSAAVTLKQLDATEKQLAMLLDDVPPRSVQREPTSRRSDGGTSRPPRAGNCTLSTGNVANLKGCIDDFNR